LMAVINPLEVVIDNYPEGKVEKLVSLNNMENPELGSHKIYFSNKIYIDQEDFVEVKPNRKWKRLALDSEVRLMNAYFIKAVSVEKDEKGEIIRVHATYDPATKGGDAPDGRKPNGTIQYVDAATGLKANFNLFDVLVFDEVEGEEKSFIERLNPNSREVREGFIEAEAKNTVPGDHFQFVRTGYFCTDKLSTKEKLIFNRTCSLKSSFNPIK